MIDDDRPLSLEKALAKTEADVVAALKAAASATASLRRIRAAAQVGNLRNLRPAMLAAEQTIAALRQQFSNAKEGWDFDEDAYLASHAFPRELLDVAERMNLRIFEQDDRLYCYPALIRVLPPKDRAVLIDKAREPRLRPTVLINQLKELQGRPVRSKPELFLECLFEAYSTLVAKRGRGLFGDGQVEKLQDVYKLLTLLPGQSREYSRQEFTRDIYVLDRSGVSRTRGGQVVSFPFNRGPVSSTFRIPTQDGAEKLYYGVAFSAPA